MTDWRYEANEWARVAQRLRADVERLTRERTALLAVVEAARLIASSPIHRCNTPGCGVQYGDGQVERCTVCELKAASEALDAAIEALDAAIAEALPEEDSTHG